MIKNSSNFYVSISNISNYPIMNLQHSMEIIVNDLILENETRRFHNNHSYTTPIIETISSNSNPTPEFSTIFLVINLALMIPLSYFNTLIIRMAKREKKKNEQTLLCKVLSIYARVNIFSTFFVIINANGVMSFVYPVSQTFGAWYCYAIEILLHISGMYVGTISLLVASLRYYFIVHHDQVDRNGREQKITRFVVIYIAINSITSIVNSLTNGIVDDSFWEKQCFGHKNEVFHNKKQEHSFVDVIPNLVCYNREYQLRYYIGVNLNHYFEPILRFFCGISTLFCLLILSNGIELVLYLITLRHMDR